jgi:DNA-binding NtrC family response regulator
VSDRDPEAADARPRVRVLIAEDEAHLGTLLEQFLIGRGHDVTLVRDGRAALEALHARDYDVALTDVQMPGMDGLALLAAARALPLAPEVIVVTGNGAAETQLRALRQGAYDAVAKPYRMAEIDLLVHRAAEKRALRRALAACALADAPALPFHTTDAGLADAVARVESAPGAPLLLIGEPGTGKRTLARWLHARAGRAGPFVDLDASVAPPDARAALATRDGTLLVRHAERLATDAVPALVAAARAPEAAHALIVAVDRVDDGRGAALRAPFGDGVVELPRLRARPSDVPLLAERIAERMHGAPLPLAGDARAALVARDWPGNAAELAGVVAAAVARVPADARELPLAALEAHPR